MPETAPEAAKPDEPAIPADARAWLRANHEDLGFKTEGELLEALVRDALERKRKDLARKARVPRAVFFNAGRILTPREIESGAAAFVMADDKGTGKAGLSVLARAHDIITLRIEQKEWELWKLKHANELVESLLTDPSGTSDRDAILIAVSKMTPEEVAEGYALKPDWVPMECPQPDGREAAGGKKTQVF